MYATAREPPSGLPQSGGLWQASSFLQLIEGWRSLVATTRGRCVTCPLTVPAQSLSSNVGCGQSGGIRRPVFAGQPIQLSKFGITNFKLWQTNPLGSFWERVPWNIDIDYDAAPDSKVPPSVRPFNQGDP